MRAACTDEDPFELEDERWWNWQRGNDSDAAARLAKRSDAPPAAISLGSILGGKTGTSGWKKWYEGWSVSSRKNEYLPGGGERCVSCCCLA